MTSQLTLGDRVGVVMRSSGERTEALCRELALAQGIGEDQIAIVREAPFARALRASYEMGIQLGRPWTLCLDADVLLLPGAIADMVTLADRQASSLFEFAGQVLDKFFGGSRGAGHRLYRTALLSEGVECIPLGHNPIRPEWHTIEVMRSRGHPWRHMTYLAGLHDFEQYNRDIFRQCFVYAHKHQKFTELFLSYWRAERSADQDYEVALRGFLAGLQFEGELVIDSRHEIIREQYDRLQMIEKAPLGPGALSGPQIAELAGAWTPPPAYHSYFPGRRMERERTPLKSRVVGLRDELSYEMKVLRPWTFLLHTLGRGFSKLGSWLKDKADFA